MNFFCLDTDIKLFWDASLIIIESLAFLSISVFLPDGTNDITYACFAYLILYASNRFDGALASDRVELKV